MKKNKNMNAPKSNSRGKFDSEFADEVLEQNVKHTAQNQLNYQASKKS